MRMSMRLIREMHIIPNTVPTNLLNRKILVYQVLEALHLPRQLIEVDMEVITLARHLL
jgi:hypothetical protein